MTKSKFMRIVLVAGIALIIIGVALITWMLVRQNDQSVIVVKLEDDKTQSVEFKNLSFIPGEECEYTVTLKSRNMSKCALHIDFAETEENTLKNFARVKILANGEVLCDELLATVFENDDIVLSVDFTEEKNTDLKIVYYLPVDVGNEAKNAEAIFELLLTANNK